MKQAQIERKLQQLTYERDRFQRALDDIINPLSALQRKADATGGVLNGYAHQIANSPGFLQDIAKEALGLCGHARKPTREECFAVVETLTPETPDRRLDQIMEMIVRAQLHIRTIDSMTSRMSKLTNIHLSRVRKMFRTAQGEAELERTLIDMACPE